MHSDFKRPLISLLTQYTAVRLYSSMISTVCTRRDTIHTALTAYSVTSARQRHYDVEIESESLRLQRSNAPAFTGEHPPASADAKNAHVMTPSPYHHPADEC